MGSLIDAASVILNLFGYHVIDLPLGVRLVIAQAGDIGDRCPDCGVWPEGVHPWCRQRGKELPHPDGSEVVVVKSRLVCAELAGLRCTFT